MENKTINDIKAGPCIWQKQSSFAIAPGAKLPPTEETLNEEIIAPFCHHQTPCIDSPIYNGVMSTKNLLLNNYFTSQSCVHYDAGDYVK